MRYCDLLVIIVGETASFVEKVITACGIVTAHARKSPVPTVASRKSDYRLRYEKRPVRYEQVFFIRRKSEMMEKDVNDKIYVTRDERKTEKGD